MRVVLALSVAFVAAMFVWFAGMFISGQYYWFMQTGDFGENAGLTRVEMLLMATIFGGMTFLTYKDKK